MSVAPYLLRPVLEGMRRKQIPKDQIILYPGDSANEAYIVASGFIKIYDIDENGSEKILHIVKDSALIPFSFYSGHEATTQWFYAALTDCELFVIPRERLIHEMQSNSKLCLHLMQRYSLEMNEIMHKISSLNKTNVNGKLYMTLMSLALNYSEKKRGAWREVEFPVSHQLLANLSGITRESTTIFLKELSEAGVTRSPSFGLLEINTKKLEAFNAQST